MAEPSVSFDEHDIHELDEFLAELQNDDALHLDGVHGLLTALAIGPEAVGPEEWLPMILGQQPTVHDPSVIEEIVQRTLQLSRAIEYGLEHFAFDPVFASREHASGEPSVEVGGWCEGFSLGIDLRAPIWEAQMRIDPGLVDLLAPIVQLGVDDGVFGELQEQDIPALSEAEREELLLGLPGALLAVRHYWQEHEAVLSSERPAGTRLH